MSTSQRLANCLPLAPAERTYYKTLYLFGGLPQYVVDMGAEERLPVSEQLKVIDYITLYKTAKWWSAVALVDSFGRRQIAIYLWVNRAGQWKRKQKFVVHNRGEWASIKEAVEKLTAAANSIWVDYFAIVPVTDGWRRPQDMAHNAMRPVELAFTIVPR